MTALAATRVGEGPTPVVVLHGFLGSSRNVATLARGLAARDPSLTVIAFDLPGHGASPPLPPNAGVGALARSVLESCAPLAAPVRFVGHSLGGRVALTAAILAPASVAHLTLLDVTPSPRPPSPDVAATVEALLAAPDDADSRDVVREHLRAAHRPPEIVEWLLTNLHRDGSSFRWQFDRAALAALLPRIGAEDLWPAVEGPRRYGVHCLRGALSNAVGDADAARLAAAGCRVDTVEGAGHFVHVERPQATLDAVADGLR